MLDQIIFDASLRKSQGNWDQPDSFDHTRGTKRSRSWLLDARGVSETANYKFEKNWSITGGLRYDLRA
jgi:hypothetical protein